MASRPLTSLNEDEAPVVLRHLVNLTRHYVMICDQDDQPKLRLEVSNTRTTASRLTEHRELVEQIALPNGLLVPLYEITYSGLNEALPNEQPNTYNLVPRLIADQVSNRQDLIFPYDLVRKENSNFVDGCRSFARFNPSNHRLMSTTPNSR